MSLAPRHGPSASASVARPIATLAGATMLGLLGALALACGGGGERAAESAAPSPGDSVGVPAPGHLVADSAPRPPALLAAACIAGEPEEGHAWVIDSAALSPLQVEWIESLASRDSALLAVRLARMVDVIPVDTSVADFRGLPVTVRGAARVVHTEGDTVIVSVVDRRLPMESSPLEERFTVIAAPGHRSGVRDALVEGWFAREAGTEERLVARDLGGVFATDSGIVVAFIEESETRVGAALIERVNGRWTPRWSGPLPRCGAR